MGHLATVGGVGIVILYGLDCVGAGGVNNGAVSKSLVYRGSVEQSPALC
ncbi:hypothetical protein KCP71_12495 [Salmonella enterica subsp. enterica]|nr:hypothetical protein KCP71_12495 [Salmonella enterica subsp. enterica]